MTRYVCIHGHFYQPPRENPRTGLIERQPSASPFPDWNHRISRECYRANTNAAIIDDTGAVQNRVNKASNLLPEEVIRSGVSTSKMQSSLVYIL